MKIGLWSTTAGSNSAAPPDGWPEGQAPSTVNDCAREMMAAIKTAFIDLQWPDHGHSPTYINANSFSIPGNQLAVMQTGRQLKLYDGGTSIYRAIAAASFTTVTTISLGSGTSITNSLSSFGICIIEATNAPHSTLTQSFASVAIPTGILRTKNGNAATPSIHMDSADTDTGFYWISDGIIGFATNAVEGARLSQGGFLAAAYAVSDERLKQDWQALPVDFVGNLAQLKSGTFTFRETGATAVGVSAQSLRDILPCATTTRADDGMLAIQYGPAAMAACVELAKEVVALRSELDSLKGKP